MNTTNNDACREAFCKINKITAEFLQKELSDGGSPWHSTFNNYSHGYQAALASVQQSQSVEALQKEVERLTQALDEESATSIRLCEERRPILNENERLKAEVETVKEGMQIALADADQLRQQLAQPAGNVGDEVRAGFEAWAHGFGLKLVRLDHGYEGEDDNNLWVAYQNAWDRASREAHRLETKLNHAYETIDTFAGEKAELKAKLDSLLSAPVVKAEQLAAKVPEQHCPEISPRQPYIEGMPDGYMESDNDFLERNAKAAIYLLDRELSAATPQAAPEQEGKL